MGGDHGALNCNHLVRKGIVVGRQFVPLWLTNQDRITDVEKMRSHPTFEIRVGLCLFHRRCVEFLNRGVGRRLRRDKRQLRFEAAPGIHQLCRRDSRRWMWSRSIRPQEIVHRLLPILIFNMGCSNHFSQAFHKRFRLTIRLRPEGRNLLVVEAKFPRKSRKALAIKWWPVVRTNGVRNAMGRKHFLHSKNDACRIRRLTAQEDFDFWPL